MYIIKNGDFSVAQKGEIYDYIDTGNGYRPKVEFEIVYNEKGFAIRFFVYESEPKAVFTEHFSPVHLDSCVEWFANFAPEINDKYFNFEVNAKGTMNVSFRKSRYEYVDLSKEDVESLHIKTDIQSDMWTAEYFVPFALIKKYIPMYDCHKNKKIMANLFKCGNETKYMHYGCWSMVDRNKPDFHQPCYFKEMCIE